MSVAVGAALKKIAVAILTDRDALKTVGMILLTIAVAILLPVMALAAILNGSIQLDVPALMAQIDANLLDADRAMLNKIDTTMREISAALVEREMPERVKEAQALYIMALYDHSDQPGFVSRLVSCFQEDQTDEELIAAVNSTFGSSISVDEFSQIAEDARSSYIDYTGFGDPGTKNNLDLVAFMKEAHASGWGYVWGTKGQVLTPQLFDALLRTYPSEVGDYKDYIQSHWMGKRTADCSGLIKAYSWFDPETQSVGYETNGMPDINSRQMIDWCREKGPMSTMPEIPGLLLWMEGHVGIYIGNGYAIEAMNTRRGVVQTSVAGRGWERWGKLPCIDYIEEQAETAPAP